MADASVEALLRALTSSDDSSGSESSSQQSSGRNNPMADLRSQLETVLAEKKASDKALQAKDAELLKYRQEAESRVFESLSVTDKTAELFRLKHKDEPVTEEAVKKFLADFGIGVPVAGGDTVVPETPDPTPTTTPTPTPQGGSNQPVKWYSPEDIRRIGVQDEARALQIIAQQSEPDPNNPGQLRMKVAPQ